MVVQAQVGRRMISPRKYFLPRWTSATIKSIRSHRHRVASISNDELFATRWNSWKREKSCRYHKNLCIEERNGKKRNFRAIYAASRFVMNIWRRVNSISGIADEFEIDRLSLEISSRKIQSGIIYLENCRILDTWSILFLASNRFHCEVGSVPK